MHLFSKRTAVVGSVTTFVSSALLVNKSKEEKHKQLPDIFPHSKYTSDTFYGVAFTNKILTEEKAREWIIKCEKDTNLQRIDYGQLNKLFDMENETTETRNFLVSDKMNQLDNQHFEFVLYLNENEKKIVGLCYFGKYLQGRPGMTHGGASASVMDGLMGEICFVYGYKAATLNLNVNYKKFLPLDTVVLLETKIDKIEGRKLFVSSALKDLQDETPYAEATSLYIVPRNAIQEKTA